MLVYSPHGEVLISRLVFLDNWPRILHILNYNSFRLNYVDFWGHNDAVSDSILPTIHFEFPTTNEKFPSLGYARRYLVLQQFSEPSTSLKANPEPLLILVGNGALTTEENRSHFALWAAMKSPLLIGTSVIHTIHSGTPLHLENPRS